MDAGHSQVGEAGPVYPGLEACQQLFVLTPQKIEQTPVFRRIKTHEQRLTKPDKSCAQSTRHLPECPHRIKRGSSFLGNDSSAVSHAGSQAAAPLAGFCGLERLRTGPDRTQSTLPCVLRLAVTPPCGTLLQARTRGAVPFAFPPLAVLHLRAFMQSQCSEYDPRHPAAVPLGVRQTRLTSRFWTPYVTQPPIPGTCGVTTWERKCTHTEREADRQRDRQN